MTDPY